MTPHRLANPFFGALLVLAIVAVYWPGRHGGFVFDDFPNIVENVALHVDSLLPTEWLAATFSSPASAFQRPLAMLTLAINHYFTGLDPMPMKLVNIGIHAANALLVFVLVRRLLASAAPDASARRRAWAARFVAAAWALHPLQLMAVLYVVQRMESLSHLFVLAGLVAYVAGRQRQLDGKAGGALILGGIVGGAALGVLAKESAALLPVYTLALELCVFRFRGRSLRQARLLLAMYAGGLVLPGVAGLAWIWPQVAGVFASRDFGLDERLLTEARVLVDYLRWTLLPDPRVLSLYHDDYVVSRGLLDPISTLASVAIMAVLVASATWLRKRRPVAAVGIAWFLSAHLLTATIIPLELVYEHRNYFASLGVMLVLADLLVLLPRNRAAVPTFVAAAMVLLFALATSLRAQEWRDPFTFAQSESLKHPTSPRAAYGLAQLLVVATNYDPESPFRELAWQALAKARAIHDGGILPQSAALLLEAHMYPDRPQDAEVWRELIERVGKRQVGAQEIGALTSLVRCARSGECKFAHDRMEAAFDAALAHGRHPDVLTMRGDYALNVRGDVPVALALWREAVQRAPAQAQYRINLAKLLIALGREQEARQEIATLRRLGRLGQNEAAAANLEARLRNATARTLVDPT